ncbi:MAG: toll/interleukin-1 receptor domain-containing protein [Hyphomicrobiaceae bacterium]
MAVDWHIVRGIRKYHLRPFAVEQPIIRWVKVDVGQVRAVAPEPCVTPELTGASARRYQHAFLSYASEDRAEVLKRAQVFNIDFFQDILSLSPGERYEKKIYAKIVDSDLFMLFWSRHAHASEWVGKEIDYARERQQQHPEGLPDIVPIVLEDPPVAPPPKRLGDRHFNDPIATLIAFEQGKRRSGFWAGLLGR